MLSLYTFTNPPSPCGYLPDQKWRLQYEIVVDITPAEYDERLNKGWRRFGHALFRPTCPSCQACRSIRVPVAGFRPDRSQKRAAQLNEGTVKLQIGTPSADPEKIELYDRFHLFQRESKGWPAHDPEDVENYAEAFVQNPFATEEWTYRIDDRLVGVGYVDRLPTGLSAIYFFYDPAERHRSLGVWNVLSILREASRSRLPYVYLGYFVEGCRSLEYKARYRPNELLTGASGWKAFL